MKRREFLRGAGLAGIAPVLAACTRTLSPLAGAMGAVPENRDPDGVWREGTAYARWTPSPHNIQPWLLRVVSPTHAELLYDPSRLIPKLDPSSAFTIAGLTMFAEFLSVAVGPLGYSVRADYLNRRLDYAAAEPSLFANLELVPRSAASDLDRNVILKRQTSRLPYDGFKVDESAMKSLGSIAAGFGNAFEWSSDDDFVKWLIDLNRFTLFNDLDRDEERNELRRWIRTSAHEAATKKDGLWSECLRFPGWLLKAFFDEHEKWGKGWRAEACGKMLVEGMHGTRTAGWWSGPFEEPADWIQAGRALGRSWLELAGRGIHMHPFGSVITNPVAYTRLVRKLSRGSGSDPIWLLARIGRSDAPPRSYRLDERSIFLSEKA
jgi:hypothetical protein